VVSLNAAEEQHRLFAMSLFERVLSSSGYQYICGIDEAGRGPLAGPVVAASVIFPQGFSVPGLRDSKLLTPLQRETLFDQIMQRALSVGIGIVDNDIIDRINILQATLLAMQKSVEQLHFQPDYLLIDALTLPGFGVSQKGIIHGDNLSVSIAAASVVAKVTRDRLMCQYHEEFPAYRFNSHKGYGTQEHLEKIKEFGPCRLHRRTFRGVIQ
jgi:ribonuclease HII